MSDENERTEMFLDADGRLTETPDTEQRSHCPADCSKWSVQRLRRPGRRQWTVWQRALADDWSEQHRRRKGSVVGGGHHGECGARAYNGGLGTEPPVGSRGRAPGQGVRRAKTPWSWKHFGHWMSNGAGKFSSSLWKQYVLLRSTGVRVGGGQSAWCHQPRHWGAGGPPRPSPGSAAYAEQCGGRGTPTR